MSKGHFTFRLGPSDPDEQRALEIIQDWVDAGWDLRQIVTRALLALKGEVPIKPDLAQTVSELQNALNQAYQLIDRLQRSPLVPGGQSPPSKGPIHLDQQFIDAVQKGMQPGKGTKGVIDDE